MAGLNGVISTHEFSQRRQNVQEQAARKGLDGLIAFSGFLEREGHVAYLTNYHIPHPNIVSLEGIGYSAVILPLQGDPVLIAPGGYGLQKVMYCESARVGANLIREAAIALKSLGMSAGKIGIAGTDVIPARYYLQLQKDFPQATFIQADEILEKLRMIKSSTEITLMKQAAYQATRIVKAGMAAAQPGISGIQIEAQMLSACPEIGVDLIHRNRINSGKQIHPDQWPPLDQRTIEDGDFVLIEAAGWYQGYGFECTRVMVAGEGSKEQQDFLEHITEAADWMIGTLKTGVQWTYYMAESRAREIHAIGNGIGLEIYEHPLIQIEKPVKLMAGMTLSIKPSLGSRQFGKMAIGEMVLMTENGVEVLTAHSRFD